MTNEILLTMEAEIIKHNNKRYAFIIRKQKEFIGKQFFGESKDFLQIGYMNLNKNDVIQPHKHIKKEIRVKLTQEVLYMLSGKMKVNFYDSKNKIIDNTILFDGDLIILLSGGHGFEFLEDSKIIEIKQGPYKGKEKDKVIIKEV